MNTGRFGILPGLILLTIMLGACANRPINQPITQVDNQSGYRGLLQINQRSNNRSDTLFVLSFSGGGTRAAALSYGVLEELRKVVHTTSDGQTHRLLDEVDVITGVSGGSFTALSYALYQDRLFDEYEQRFLRRDIEGALAARSFLYPVNWFKLTSGNYGRSEIAADLYDEVLFEGARFQDLVDSDGPVAIASATDITTGSRFSFYQNYFDLICSDLSAMKLSRAAAASSAVPLALSPVTLNNFGGQCGYQYPVWVQDIKQMDPSKRPIGRELELYKQMAELQDSKNRPFIHLVDGGISDNIGVRGVLETLEELFFSSRYKQQTDFKHTRHIFLIVVNAHSAHPRNWEQKESPPGSLKLLTQASVVPIDRYSLETVQLLKDRADLESSHRKLQVAEARLAGATQEEADALYPETEIKVLDVNFENLNDPGERSYFMHLPTSFSLQDEQVDKLRAVAGTLLRQSSTYQEILQDFHNYYSGQTLPP